VPFCRKLCYYCACTKTIVPDEQRAKDDPAESFLDGIEQELDQLPATVHVAKLHKIHLGGGSPSFLTPAQTMRLWQLITDRLQVVPGAEIAVELDPRTTTRDLLDVYHTCGFNRISIGVQDFDPKVQAAIGREQSFEQVKYVTDRARLLGIRGINFDLIYGLPWQTPASLGNTLDRVIALAPDRIAWYRLAVIPEIFKWQKAFTSTDLLSGERSLALAIQVVTRLRAAGYVMVGLDHFARPDDDLVRAWQSHTLVRSFQGMETGTDGIQTIGIGPSAISTLNDGYRQNFRDIKTWKQKLATGLPVEKWDRFSDADRMERWVLQELYCYGTIDMDLFRANFQKDFLEHFADRIAALEIMTDQGILERTQSGYRLTEPLGRLLVRVPAAALDRYLPVDAWKTGLPEGRASRTG
jgi:oxygen-independent coproporphyrinogen-3 oxidase